MNIIAKHNKQTCPYCNMDLPLEKYNKEEWLKHLERDEIEKAQIEHCDEPDCPECNLMAYNKGKRDMRDEIIEKINSRYVEWWTEYGSCNKSDVDDLVFDFENIIKSLE